ncbi:hypothetical protein B0H19DRAFT_1384854 [Mycena capillaripes]|nr:hypothetical protein B0H19DRAFT_1384854 [Mycena capillaripes]
MSGFGKADNTPQQLSLFPPTSHSPTSLPLRLCPSSYPPPTNSGRHAPLQRNQFFKSVFLVIVYASSLLALTMPTNSKHATRRVRSIANNVKLETFHPVSTYETFGTGIDHVLRKRDTSLKAGFSSDVASHAYADQPIDGIIVSNAVYNVTFNSDSLVTVGFLQLDRFIIVATVTSTTPPVSFDETKTITVAPTMTVNFNAAYVHVRFSPAPFANYLQTGT